MIIKWAVKKAVNRCLGLINVSFVAIILQWIGLGQIIKCIVRRIQTEGGFVSRLYCARYDAYYDSRSGNWLEKRCSDLNCCFCADRPKSHNVKHRCKI